MTLQEPAADEIADRRLDGVVFIEVAGVGVERLGDLRNRQAARRVDARRVAAYVVAASLG